MPAQPVELLDRKLLIVSGKGGTGKSTVSAALALLAADMGKKVLVGEIDAKGNLSACFEAGATRFQEREVSPGVWAMSMDPEESLQQYLQLQLRLPLVTRVGPLSRIFDFVATAAPGVREIVTIGKFAWEVRKRHYDLVIIDAVASGHIIGHLASPQTIKELVQVGPIRNQTGWMLDLMGDRATTGAVIVTTPEEMPVTETLELAERLRNETVVDLAAVVVNRVLPELFGRGEEEIFDRLVEAEAKAGDDLAPLDDAIKGDAGPLLAGAELAVRRRRNRAAHLERLRASVEASVPLLYVPYLFTRDYGLRSTHRVADELGAELGVI